jgi:hypothetical protein
MLEIPEFHILFMASNRFLSKEALINNYSNSFINLQVFYVKGTESEKNVDGREGFN